MDTPVATSGAQQSLPPTTTSQQDVITARQSRINLIWEITQAIIAVSITLARIYAALYIATAPESLSNAFFLIVGFYFSRTNHAAIGGVGLKPIEEYQGR